ncbi:unnamed protein product, partial [marine sediment metagenome]
AEDIYRIGGEVSDYDLAEILARNSGEAFKYLDELGVPFVKKNGKVDQFLTDGSKYPRACYTGPYTANHIEEALVRKINTLDIQILENHLTAELLVSEDRKRVVGAIGLDMHDTGSGRNPSLFLTKAIILATGGAGQVFEGSVFPPELTGDGCAMGKYGRGRKSLCGKGLQTLIVAIGRSLPQRCFLHHHMYLQGLTGSLTSGNSS